MFIKYIYYLEMQTIYSLPSLLNILQRKRYIYTVYMVPQPGTLLEKILRNKLHYSVGIGHLLNCTIFITTGGNKFNWGIMQSCGGEFQTCSCKCKFDLCSI